MAQSHSEVGRNVPNDAQTVEIELPITVDSDLSQDPVAGTIGTITQLVYEDCDCGSKIARHTKQEPAGVHNVECVACEKVHYQG